MLRFDLTLRAAARTGELIAAANVGPGITLLDGPNGAGKSTLLALLAGVVAPDAGIVQWADKLWTEDGQALVAPQDRGIGWLPQAPSLVPHWTVERHLVELQRCRPPAPAFAPRAIQSLGLASLLHRRAETLSAGEAQRVGLLRALIACRGLLLLDEPTSAMQPAMASSATELVRDLVAEQGWTALIVSHQPLPGLPLVAHLRMEEGRFLGS